MTFKVDPDIASALSERPMTFFIGPRKTGTSWINLYLEAREDVLTPRTTKETFFFDRYFNRGPAWYLKQFQTPPDGNGMLVECAPSYAGSEDALQRIAEGVPNARLVITLRDPVSRVQSHWRHLIRYGQNAGSLSEAMAEGQELWADSRYAAIVDKAVDLVGPDRVGVVLYEDLRQDPGQFAKSVCAAMGLPFEPPQEGSTERKMNTAQRPRNATLSALATRGAETLRNMGLHRLVRVARKAGLRNVLERPYDTGEAVIDTEAAAMVRDRLAPEIDGLLTRLDAMPQLVPLGEADRVGQVIRGWLPRDT